MSPLTKAFVVLTTLLSIVMVSLTVAHVARTEDYRAKFKDMQTARDAALERAANAEAVVANGDAAATESVADLEAALSQVRSELASKLGEIRNRDQAIANLQTNLARLTAAQEAVTATLNAANDRLGSQDDQIRSLLTELDGVARQKGEVERALVVARADRERYSTEVRRLTERLIATEAEAAAIETDRDRLAELVNSLEIDPDAQTTGTGVRIAGAVTNVDQIGDGLTLVQVNVGARDGVQANMPFTIFRGSQYVGTIVITTVDTDMAVGELELSTDEIRNGDSVKTGGE